MDKDVTDRENAEQLAKVCGPGALWGRASERDQRLGKKKTLESWLQGRLPFVWERLGAQEQGLPSMADRSNGN